MFYGIATNDSHIIKDQIENLDQPAEDAYGAESEVYKMDQDEA
jgi:hypothetical protein